MAERIHCLHSGCKATFPRQEDHRLHVKSCLFKEEKCDACEGCYLRKDSVKHMTEICDYRTAACVFCGEMFMFVEISGHQESCLKKTINCQFCARDFLKEDEDSHVETCDRKPVTCSMKDFGCEFKDQRQCLEIHQQDLGLHFHLVCRAVKGLGDTVDRAGEFNKKLDESVGLLLSENNRLKEINANLIQSVQDMKSDISHLKEANQTMIEVISESFRNSFEQRNMDMDFRIQEQKIFNAEMDNRMNRLESKVNQNIQPTLFQGNHRTLNSTATASIDHTLNITDHDQMFPLYGAVDAMKDILSVQVFNSLEIGRDNITVIDLGVKFDGERCKSIEDVQIHGSNYIVDYRKFHQPGKVFVNLTIESKATRRGWVPKRVDRVDRAVLCLMDPGMEGGLMCDYYATQRGKCLNQHTTFSFEFKNRDHMFKHVKATLLYKALTATVIVFKHPK